MQAFNSYLADVQTQRILEAVGSVVTYRFHVEPSTSLDHFWAVDAGFAVERHNLELIRTCGHVVLAVERSPKTSILFTTHETEARFGSLP